MLIQNKSSTYDPTREKNYFMVDPWPFYNRKFIFFILQIWLSLPTNSTHLPMWFRNLDGLHVRDTKTSLQTPLKHYWYDMHSFPFVWQQYKRLQSPPPLMSGSMYFYTYLMNELSTCTFQILPHATLQSFFFFQEWDYSWVITL